MNYGFIDFEMTCDGQVSNGKFIDDGRMKRSQREIISVGFVACDDKYNIKNRYSSYIKPVHNTILSDYCLKLTGITQAEADRGKKGNNAFRDIYEMCKRYEVHKIFVFGNADKMSISTTAKWIRREKGKADFLYMVSDKIIDIRPVILKRIGCKNLRRSPGLMKIAESLEINRKGEQHNALDDAMTLFKICRALDSTKESESILAAGMK